MRRRVDRGHRGTVWHLALESAFGRLQENVRRATLADSAQTRIVVAGSLLSRVPPKSPISCTYSSSCRAPTARLHSITRSLLPPAAAGAVAGDLVRLRARTKGACCTPKRTRWQVRQAEPKSRLCPDLLQDFCESSCSVTPPSTPSPTLAHIDGVGHVPGRKYRSLSRRELRDFPFWTHPIS